jgi:hypothetical protein
MADKETDIGLYESTKLFAETMAERYFNDDDSKNGILILVLENGKGSSVIGGDNALLADCLSKAMVQNGDIDTVINSAFIGVHGKAFYQFLKTKIKNNEDLPGFSS